MKHYLQRAPWAELQKSLNREVVKDSGVGWEYQAFIETGKLGKRLYCPYGPYVTDAGALPTALNSLLTNAKKLGTTFVRFEPTGNVSAEDVKLTGAFRVAHKQPEHTQRINIDRDFSEVLAEMDRSPRNLHRNYAKKGISVRVSENPDEVERLIELLDEVASRTGMVAHDSDYLRANAHSLMPLGAAKMYLAELEDEVIAASLVFDDEDCRYYAHAAANTKNRNLKPGPVLVTQMIADAAAGGQKFFDLYGVVPVDQKDHPWFGFSEFKRTFGGEQIDFLGTWEIPVKKLSYKLIQLVRKVFKDKL